MLREFRQLPSQLVEAYDSEPATAGNQFGFCLAPAPNSSLERKALSSPEWLVVERWLQRAVKSRKSRDWRSTADGYASGG